MNRSSILKYPRTRHLEGSNQQPGDEDLSYVRFEEIRKKYLVVEEKVDGANCAIRFSEGGRLLLQSRGHYLTGGNREKHFALFKTWAESHQAALFQVLTDRYVMFGEWLYAKHTIFYDALPHYFLEFDVYDTQKELFLDTPTRHDLLSPLPVCSVRVLEAGRYSKQSDLPAANRSALISDGQFETLREICRQRSFDFELVSGQTDRSNLMEGLYIKVEENGRVVDRIKWIRSEFLQCVASSKGHWLNRPIIPNQLNPHVDLFATEIMADDS